MHIFAISELLVGITSFILGNFVLYKNRGNKVNIIWAIFCFLVAIWGFGGFKASLADDKLLALLWYKITYIGIIFIPVVFYHFVCLFLEIKRKKTIYLYYFFGFFFLILEWTALDYLFFSINNISFFFNSFYWVFPPTPLFTFFVFSWFFIVLCSLLELIKIYAVSKGLKRIQISYFFLGMAIAFLGGSTCFMPCFGIDLYPYFNFIIIFYTLTITYAIVRHHLFDIRVIIQRGLIYSSLLAVITAFYLITIFIIGLFVQRTTNATILFAAGLTTLAGIYGAPIVEKYFRRITDKIFYKDKYDYSEAIYALSQVLNKNVELESLLRQANKKLKDILKVEKIRISLLEQNIVIDEFGRLRKPLIKLSRDNIKKIENYDLPILLLSKISYLKKDLENKGKFKEYKDLFELIKNFGKNEKIDLFLPIKLESRLIGIVMLGEKRSGDMFNADDFNLLKIFSNQAAIALMKAQYYAKIKNYSRDLEKEVKARTAKIKGLQEEQRQTMLEVSHGLQTPLTVIKGELEFLKKDLSGNKVLKRFEKSIDKISGFIYSLLKLARLESLKSDFKKEPVDLSDLIKESIEYFEVVLAEQNIKIVYNVEPGIYILGNKEKLEEALTNLVSNAAKYIDEKKKDKKIIIKLAKKDCLARLIVEDNGIGINKEDLLNIFQRFYRSKDSKHSNIKGTGLGLVVCKKIIEMHNGQIKAKSQIGQGAKFTINFNIYDRKQDKQA